MQPFQVKHPKVCSTVPTPGPRHPFAPRVPTRHLRRDPAPAPHELRLRQSVRTSRRNGGPLRTCRAVLVRSLDVDIHPPDRHPARTGNRTLPVKSNLTGWGFQNGWSTSRHAVPRRSEDERLNRTYSTTTATSSRIRFLSAPMP